MVVFILYITNLQIDIGGEKNKCICSVNIYISYDRFKR